MKILKLKKVKNLKELKEHPLVEGCGKGRESGIFEGTDIIYSCMLIDGYKFANTNTVRVTEPTVKYLLDEFNSGIIKE